jgi:hypothetical protein
LNDCDTGAEATVVVTMPYDLFQLRHIQPTRSKSLRHNLVIPSIRCRISWHEPREVRLSGRDPKLGSSNIVAVDHAAGLAVFTLTIDPIVGAVVCIDLKVLVE